MRSALILFAVAVAIVAVLVSRVMPVDCATVTLTEGGMSATSTACITPAGMASLQAYGDKLAASYAK